MATTESVPSPVEAEGPAPTPAAPAPPPAPAGRQAGEARGLQSSLLMGFAVAALVDAALVFVLLPLPAAGFGARAFQLFFTCGHVLAMGLVLGAGASLLDRFLPPARFTRAGITLAVAFVAAWIALRDDLSIFGLGLRAAFTAPVALAFAGIVLLAPLVRRVPLVRALWVLLGVVAALANHLVLASNYPGSHLALTALTGVAFAVGMLDLPMARSLAPRTRRIVELAATSVASLVAATSLVFWPSSVVLVEIARQQSASLFPFVAAARMTAGSDGRIASVPEAQRVWFGSREAVRPVQPTRPGLLASGKKPVVILFTIDAFRADLLERDEAKEATRNVRELAARGAWFDHARSIASSTSPALGAMFAGRYYSSLYWADKMQDGKLKPFLAQEHTVRWPALLTDAGVRTESLSSTEGLDASFGVVVGFAKEVKRVKGSDEAVKKLGTWLDGVGDGPAFAFTHVLDAHAPYSRGKKGDPAFTRYLAEMKHIDANVGELVEQIEKRGLWDRTILIVSADHGEAFGEHNTNYHGASVYEELVRVPLVVVGAGVKPGKHDAPVSLMDVGPTVLDLFGVATPGHFMGESLVPMLAGREQKPTRPILMDSGRRMQALVFPDGIKVIRNLRQTSTELYDLNADPKELRNLVDEYPDAQKRLDALAAFFSTHELKKPGYEIPYRQ